MQTMEGPKVAHDGYPLEFGVWVDNCERCRAKLLEYPDTLLIIKAEMGRIPIKAKSLYEKGADFWAEHHGIGAVREVYVKEAA